MLLEIIQKRHPFENLSQQVIMNQIFTKGVLISDTIDEKIRKLLRNLLNRDYSKRWGYEEVNKWINDEEVIDYVGDIDEKLTIEDWLKEGFTEKGAIEWMKITDNIKLAVEYKNLGFSASEAKEWIDSGIKSALLAFEWYKAGYKPVDAVFFEDNGLSVKRIVYYNKILKIPLEDLKLYIKMGIDLSNIEEITKSLPLREYIVFLDLGIKDIQEMIKWKEEVSDGLFSDLYEVKRWIDKGLNLEQAKLEKLKEVGFSIDEYKKWKEKGFKFFEAKEWKDKGFNLIEAERWRTAGFSVINAIEWKNNDFRLDEAIQWRNLGFDVKEAKEWKEEGFKPEDSTKEWRDYGFSPKEAKLWRNYSFSPSTAIDWKNYGFDDPQEARSWSSYSLSSQEARNWKQAGFSINEVNELISLRMCEGPVVFPREIKRMYFVAGYSRYYSVSEIIKWKKEGFTPKEIRIWKTLGFDLDTAKLWKSNGFHPYEAKIFISKNISISSAKYKIFTRLFIRILMILDNLILLLIYLSIFFICCILPFIFIFNKDLASSIVASIIALVVLLLLIIILLGYR